MLQVQAKHSVRPMNSKQQHRQSLTQGADYYRVTLHSEHRQGAAAEDALGPATYALKGNAVFSLIGLFPNERALRMGLAKVFVVFGAGRRGPAWLLRLRASDRLCVGCPGFGHQQVYNM